MLPVEGHHPHRTGSCPRGWTTFQAVADTPTGYTQYGWDLVADGVTRHFGGAPADYLVNPVASDKPASIRTHGRQDPVAMDTQRRRAWAAPVSVDDAVAALDAQLTASGVADNTVLIFMTDNGYAFGEHRWYGKACEYRVCSQTPLRIRYPGLAARSIPRMVSNVDIAGTVADVTPGVAQDGRSVLPLMQGSTAWRDEILQHWPGHRARPVDAPDYVPPYWSIRTPTHLYVELGTGERELYDRRSDPNELRNVAGQPAVAQVEARLATRLAALRATAG